MNPIIISCRTIEDELQAAMAQLRCPYPVRWLESGLHNVPKKLNARLQELLDDCGGYDTVLLAMSFCGNSLVGLRTGGARLVIPRCDDCITLLLGSQARRQAHFAAYFLTEGWLRGERNIWAEYQSCLEKYGPKRGRRIFDTMFAHYKSIALVDTGAYDTAAARAQAQQIADTLGLELQITPGTLEYLRALLSGDWPRERFAVIPPHSTVTLADCTLKGAPNEP